MLVSERYYELTGRKFVYNIMPLSNMDSVLNHGILSYHEAAKLPKHTSIAMDDVQAIRENVNIEGHSLHDYASMYFSFRNPMMYKRRFQAENLCVLAIHSLVLDIEGCVVSDQNAASLTVRFYDADIGIEKIDFEKVFADNWMHLNAYETELHRKIKCAEVLVPAQVSYEYIAGACVLNNDAKRRLEDIGFEKDIMVKPSTFFR